MLQKENKKEGNPNKQMCVMTSLAAHPCEVKKGVFAKPSQKHLQLQFSAV